MIFLASFITDAVFVKIHLMSKLVVGVYMTEPDDHKDTSKNHDLLRLTLCPQLKSEV